MTKANNAEKDKIDKIDTNTEANGQSTKKLYEIDEGNYHVGLVFVFFVRQFRRFRQKSESNVLVGFVISIHLLESGGSFFDPLSRGIFRTSLIPALRARHFNRICSARVKRGRLRLQKCLFPSAYSSLGP